MSLFDEGAIWLSQQQISNTVASRLIREIAGSDWSRPKACIL
jgi:hypothetical protein